MPENERIHFPQKEEVVLETVEMPEVGPDEVLIRTRQTLISTGTELMMLTDSHPNDESVLPFSPGYNNIGEIVEVGANIDSSVIGERVATYGSHQQYLSRTYDGCYQVPDTLSDAEAAFFTIGEIVMNGIRRSQLAYGETVAVYGLGLLGQLTVRLAHLAGAHPVFGFDIATNRLAYLPEADDIIGLDPTTDSWEEEFESKTKQRLADVVFEVTGSPAVIPTEFSALREQGRFVVLGSPRGSSEFNFNQQCHNPGYVIIGAHNKTHPSTPTTQNPWTRPRHVELYFDLLSANRFEVEDLISHTESYKNATDVYAMLLEDRTQALGVILEWDQ